eukprot:2284089-Amphidinium_carterae.1
MEDAAATYTPDACKTKRGAGEGSLLWLKKMVADPLSRAYSQSDTWMHSAMKWRKECTQLNRDWM